MEEDILKYSATLMIRGTPCIHTTLTNVPLMQHI